MAKYHGKYHYMGALQYIPYLIPGVGLILAALSAFRRGNENRRHFARAILIGYLILALIVVALIVLCNVGPQAVRDKLLQLWWPIEGCWYQLRSVLFPVQPA